MISNCVSFNVMQAALLHFPWFVLLEYIVYEVGYLLV